MNKTALAIATAATMALAGPLAAQTTGTPTSPGAGAIGSSADQPQAGGTTGPVGTSGQTGVTSDQTDVTSDPTAGAIESPGIGGADSMARTQPNFNELDSNRDGELDEEELNAYGSTAVGQSGTENRSQQMMRDYDRDRSGTLNEDEMRQADEDFRAEMGTRGSDREATR